MAPRPGSSAPGPRPCWRGLPPAWRRAARAGAARARTPRARCSPRPAAASPARTAPRAPHAGHAASDRRRTAWRPRTARPSRRGSRRWLPGPGWRSGWAPTDVRFVDPAPETGAPPRWDVWLVFCCDAKVKLTTGPRPRRDWALARLYAPDGGDRSLWTGRAPVTGAPRGGPAGQVRCPRLPRCGAGAARFGRRRPRVVHGPGERRVVPPRPGPLDGGGAPAPAGLHRLRPPQPLPPQLLRGVRHQAPAN